MMKNKWRSAATFIMMILLLGFLKIPDLNAQSRYKPLVSSYTANIVSGNGGKNLNLKSNKGINRVSIKKGTYRLETLIHIIASQAGLSPSYSKELVPVDQKVQIPELKTSAKRALTKALKETSMGFKIVEGGQLLFVKQATVSGRVTNAQTGEPVEDVNIIVRATNIGTATGSEGHYSLQVPSLQDTLVFSFVGYKSRIVPINGRTEINIALQPSVIQVEELVVVGYGTKQRGSITGSVATVSSEELTLTKSTSVLNTLTGKVPGLRVMQETSAPGDFSTDIDIRGLGTPLVVIDGVPRSIAAFKRLNPSSIKSVSVVKDATASVYGVEAANGVILVQTKTGTPGELQLSYSGYVGVQDMAGFPEPVDAIGYMTLANELASHSLTSSSKVQFTEKDFEAYRSGQVQSTNWFDSIFGRYAPHTYHNISASGGSESTTYYLGLSYKRQESFLKSGDYNYQQYNIISNISSDLSERITVNLSLRAILGDKNRFYESPWWIIRAAWRQLPTGTIYANSNPKYFKDVIVGSQNPVAMMKTDVSGYYHIMERFFNSSFSVDYEVPGIDGLQATILYAYDYRTDDEKLYRKKYFTYTYDPGSDTYQRVPVNAPNRVNKSTQEFTSQTYRVGLRYRSSFFGEHNVNVEVLYEGNIESGSDFYAQREIALGGIDQLSAGRSEDQIGYGNEYTTDVNKGFIGKFNYNYDNRYFFQFNFRYDGSSKFAEGHRWGFFPSVSAGWQIADEQFWENSALSFINQFKLRASYGIVGDDAASNYQYLSGFRYPAGTVYRGIVGGYMMDGSFVNAVESSGLANKQLTWYESTILNIGFDAEAWDGLLGITVDVFRRNRSGLLATRLETLPTAVGASLPQENLERDRQVGFEIQVTHENNIGGFFYNIEGYLAYTRQKYIKLIHAPFGNSYLEWRFKNEGRYTGIRFGLEGIGRFQSIKQIRERSKEVFVGNGTLPGDFMYGDWNGDGQINGEDHHPINFSGQDPQITYGVTIAANYNNFGLKLLIQGAARSNTNFPEQLRTPTFDGAPLQTWLNRWHPVDPDADPYSPATRWIPGKHAYTGTIPAYASTYAIHNTSYARLKSVNLSYNLPITLANAIGIESAEIYVNAYNLFTISPTDLIDPEHPNSQYGYVYPISRTYNLGVNINF